MYRRTVIRDDVRCVIILSTVTDAEMRCGLAKSDEMLSGKANNLTGCLTRRPDGVDVGKTSYNSSTKDGCQALSLPAMFFDYSDLDRLKNRLPRLIIPRDNGKNSATGMNGSVDDDEVTRRADQMKAVIR